MTEKIMAAIAVEKVILDGGCYTFRSEVMEVEVLRYMRRSVGSTGEGRRRFYYEAVIKAPEKVSPEYRAWGHEKGEMTVNVTRHINKKWKRPTFPEGKNVVEVPA